MSKLIAVLLGLVAVLVFDLLDVHAQLDCDVIRTQKKKTSGSGLTLPCPTGYVPASCKCTGPCVAVFLLSNLKCRALKTSGQSAVLTATCVKDDSADYELRSASSCLGNDKILSCYLTNTNLANYLTERYTDNGVCESPDCPGCAKQVLCKKDGTNGAGGGGGSR